MNESEQKWIETHNQACGLLRLAHDLLACSSLPPRRTWVGLTDEEIDGLHEEIKVRLMGTFNTKDIYRVLEAKLKERNA
jgi:hypothetical protein